MDKIKIKSELKQIKRDLKYYIESYELSQKEAYELLYEKYFIRMRLTQNFVEIETREKIHNSFNNKEE